MLYAVKEKFISILYYLLQVLELSGFYIRGLLIGNDIIGEII